MLVPDRLLVGRGGDRRRVVTGTACPVRHRAAPLLSATAPSRCRPWWHRGARASEKCVTRVGRSRPKPAKAPAASTAGTQIVRIPRSRVSPTIGSTPCRWRKPPCSDSSHRNRTLPTSATICSDASGMPTGICPGWHHRCGHAALDRSGMLQLSEVRGIPDGDAPCNRPVADTLASIASGGAGIPQLCTSGTAVAFHCPLSPS